MIVRPLFISLRPILFYFSLQTPIILIIQHHERVNVIAKNEIQFQAECLFSLCLVLNPFGTSCSIYLLLFFWFQFIMTSRSQDSILFEKKAFSLCLLSIVYFSFSCVFHFLILIGFYFVLPVYSLLRILPPRRIRGEQIVYAASWLLTWYDFFRFCLVRQFVTGGGDYLPGT